MFKRTFLTLSKEDGGGIRSTVPAFMEFPHVSLTFLQFDVLKSGLADSSLRVALILKCQCITPQCDDRGTKCPPAKVYHRIISRCSFAAATN